MEGTNMQGKELVNSQQIIYKFLLVRARGMKHGSTAAQDRAEVFMHLFRKSKWKNLLDDRTFRRIFTDMQLAGYPVGSHPTKGYFVLKSWEDVRLAQRDCRGRISKLQIKAWKIEQSFIHKKSNKLLRVKNSPRSI
jgi:hypothetical protein